MCVCANSELFYNNIWSFRATLSVCRMQFGLPVTDFKRLQKIQKLSISNTEAIVKFVSFGLKGGLCGLCSTTLLGVCFLNLDFRLSTHEHRTERHDKTILRGYEPSL